MVRRVGLSHRSHYTPERCRRKDLLYDTRRAREDASPSFWNDWDASGKGSNRYLLQRNSEESIYRLASTIYEGTPSFL